MKVVVVLDEPIVDVDVDGGVEDEGYDDCRHSCSRS